MSCEYYTSGRSWNVRGEVIEGRIGEDKARQVRSGRIRTGKDS